MLKTVWFIALGLLGISVMILVHELAHFLIGKIFGIEAEVISFGLGPALFKWGKKQRFQLCIWPIGGCCKFKGADDLSRALARKDEHVENAEEGSLYAASPLKRLFMYLAGPLGNWIFAIFCFFILLVMPVLEPASPPKIVLASDYPALFPGATSIPSEAGLKTGDMIESVDGIEVQTYAQMQALLSERKQNPEVILKADGKDFAVRAENGIFGLAEFIKPVVASVAPGSPEAKAGLKSSDTILFVNGKKVSNMCDILLLQKQAPSMVIMQAESRGGVKNIVYKPDYEDGKMKISYTLKQEGKMKSPMRAGEALKQAGARTLEVFADELKALWKVFQGGDTMRHTVVGTFSAAASIGELTSEAFHKSFSQGLRIALSLLGGVSLSLAIANLLPIPSLDGGQIVLCLVELCAGRNASPKVYLVFRILGFFAVALLILLIHIA